MRRFDAERQGRDELGQPGQAERFGTSSSPASGRAKRIFSSIVPAKITGFWPIQPSMRVRAAGTRVGSSAPLIVTLPDAAR